MNIREFVLGLPEFKEMYEFAEIDRPILEELKKFSDNFSIKVFASKTCQYCKIYVPNLLKLYEKLLFSLELVVWEDYTEEESFDVMDEFTLTGLPTFIVYNLEGGLKEIGRIVKEPKISLEKDLLIILESM